MIALNTAVVLIHEELSPTTGSTTLKSLFDTAALLPKKKKNSNIAPPDSVLGFRNQEQSVADKAAASVSRSTC